MNSVHLIDLKSMYIFSRLQGSKRFRISREDFFFDFLKFISKKITKMILYLLDLESVGPLPSLEYVRNVAECSSKSSTFRRTLIKC